jgi:hypothetical protein
MIVFNLARTFPAANGCRILRPADRSCWILVSPCGRYRSQYWTRRDAETGAHRYRAAVNLPIVTEY